MGEKLNGSVKVIGLSIVLAGAALGWGATWAQKLNEDVYRADMKHFDDRLNRIEKKIDKLLDGRS